MKKTCVSIVLGLVVIIVTLTLLAGAYGRPPQWEYANFFYQGPPVLWRWHCPKEEVKARTLEEMCSKLQINAKGSCRQTTLSEMFDYFGTKGCELMWLHEETTESRYWFKRPK